MRGSGRDGAKPVAKAAMLHSLMSASAMPADITLRRETRRRGATTPRRARRVDNVAATQVAGLAPQKVRQKVVADWLWQKGLVEQSNKTSSTKKTS